MRHPSEAQLLAFQDDELRFWRAWTIRRHLRRCWACRGKIAGIENTIRVAGAALDGPRSISGVELGRAKWRFREAAATYEAVRIAPQRFWLAWAGVPAAAAFLGWMVWTPSPTPHTETPSIAIKAADPLESVMRAEALAPTSVSEQTFSVDIQTARHKLLQRQWQLWSAPAQERYSSRLQDPAGKLLNAVFASAGSQSEIYDEPLGLRPAGLRRSDRPQLLNSVITSGPDPEATVLAWMESQVWHPVLLAREAAEFCSANGAKLRLSRSGSILRWEADVRVRGRVVHLVLEALDGQAPRLLEVSSDSMKLRLARLRTRNGVPMSEAEAYLKPDLRLTRLPVSPATPPTPDPTAIELEVLSGIHRSRLCKTDAVQLVSDAQGTHLIAPLLNAAQKEQILSMIPPSVDIRTELPVQTNVATTPVAGSEPARRAAAEDWLRVRLHTSKREMFDLMNVLVRESEELSASSWAVMNLAERFPASRERTLNDDSRTELRSMAAEHADDVARNLATIGAVLTSLEVRQPETSISSTSSDWQSLAKDVNGLARRSSELLLHFFAAGEVATVTPDQSELPALLAELRGKLAQFRKALQN